MADLAAWLMSLIGPLATRVLVSLGIGFLSFTGVDVAVQGALSQAKAALGGMPFEVAALVARFGFFDFMSITSGGVLGGLAWMELKRIAVVGTGSNGNG